MHSVPEEFQATHLCARVPKPDHQEQLGLRATDRIMNLSQNIMQGNAQSRGTVRERAGCSPELLHRPLRSVHELLHAGPEASPHCTEGARR